VASVSWVLILIIILIWVFGITSINSLIHCGTFKSLFWYRIVTSTHKLPCSWAQSRILMRKSWWAYIMIHRWLILCPDIIHLNKFLNLSKNSQATLWRNQTRNNFLRNILGWCS
jgi:fucose permease